MRLNIKKRNALLVSVLVLGLIFLIVVLNRDGRDIRMEEKLIAVLDGPKKEQNFFIDLQQFATKKIEKICIQRPYTFKEDFEKDAGTIAVGYSYINDDATTVWWFFYDDKTSVWMRINHYTSSMTLDDLGIEYAHSRCSNTSRVWFIRDSQTSQYLYYFKEHKIGV
jgi:hypothetical protein